MGVGGFEVAVEEEYGKDYGDKKSEFFFRGI